MLRIYKLEIPAYIVDNELLKIYGVTSEGEEIEFKRKDFNSQIINENREYSREKLSDNYVVEILVKGDDFRKLPTNKESYIKAYYYPDENNKIEINSTARLKNELRYNVNGEEYVYKNIGPLRVFVMENPTKLNMSTENLDSIIQYRKLENLKVNLDMLGSYTGYSYLSLRDVINIRMNRPIYIHYILPKGVLLDEKATKEEFLKNKSYLYSGNNVNEFLTMRKINEGSEDEKTIVTYKLDVIDSKTPYPLVKLSYYSGDISALRNAYPTIVYYPDIETKKGENKIEVFTEILKEPTDLIGIGNYIERIFSDEKENRVKRLELTSKDPYNLRKNLDSDFRTTTYTVEYKSPSSTNYYLQVANKEDLQFDTAIRPKGDEFIFKGEILNFQDEQLESINVINILPEKNDGKILEKDFEKNNPTDVKLTGPVVCNTPNVKILYSLENIKYNEGEYVNDYDLRVKWLDESDVKDFSKVKAYKLIAPEGLKPRTKIIIEYPCKLNLEELNGKDINNNYALKIGNDDYVFSNISRIRPEAYIIKFDAQGGVGLDVTEKITNPYQMLESFPTTPVKSGYKFEGWYTHPNGKGKKVELYDKDSNTGTKFYRSCTVYAFWSKDDTYVPPVENNSSDTPVENNGQNFSNIVVGNVFIESDNFLLGKAYVKGYPDGSFRANNNITRAEAAAMLMRISDIDTKDVKIDGKFNDVNSGEWYSSVIAEAYNRGYIKGYPGGSFKPDNKITRAESVAILNRAYDRNTTAKSIEGFEDKILKFSDLDKNHWAYYDIINASNTHRYVKDIVYGEIWKEVIN